MRVAVTGSSGLIGQALCERLRQEGHTILRIVRTRSAQADDTCYWNPEIREIDAGRLADSDAVVHLAGESVDGRWTSGKKCCIRESRVEGTRFLCERLAAQSTPPKVLICASAMGIYGTCGSEELSEQSDSGRGFLAGVVRDWEAAVEPLQETETRIVQFRTGLVVAPHGGALRKMLVPFRLGLGGKLGSGAQFWSWVSLWDVTRAFAQALTSGSWSGAYNLTAPYPVTNVQFTQILGRVLRRPTLFPVPEFILKLIFGEMAGGTMLASLRVLPDRLQASGFKFENPELEALLLTLLGTHQSDRPK
jgi:uncharacterized protein (TIGR01777 family)